MSDAHEILEELKNHECENKMIVQDDIPEILRRGWVCKGCGKKWTVRLTQTKGLNMETLAKEAGAMSNDPFNV